MAQTINSKLISIKSEPVDGPIRRSYISTADKEPMEEPNPDGMISSKLISIKTEPISDTIQHQYLHTGHDVIPDDTKPDEMISSNLSCIKKLIPYLIQFTFHILIAWEMSQ